MPSSMNANARVDGAIAYAKAQLGKPYIWATAGPNSYDCSGLIWKAYAIGAGMKFTGRPTTYTMVAMGREVSKADLQPGDWVFPDAGHIQMYLGNGQIIEAANPRVPIRIAPLGNVWHARRVIENNLQSGSVADGATPDPAGTTYNADFANLDTLLSWTSNSQHWINLLYIIIGVTLCLIALTRMAGTDAIDIAGKVTS